MVLTKSKHELLKELADKLKEGPVHEYTINEILKSHKNSSKEEISYALTLLMRCRTDR